MKPGEPQLDEILATALELAGAEERRRFLDEACADSPALRSEVESLLAAHGAAAGFMQTGGMARPESTSPLPGEQPGMRIGHYRLLEPIGEGGFGVVWMAEQESPVRRRVALKIIKVGMDTREVVARFEAERQALALMDHPHIARVFDGGATDSGRPYFVMELVRGVPITEYCDSAQLAPAARLELFLQVCHAVQHAHQKGVIHRDLKPSNVLVTELDGRAVPKVIDFGVAKATATRLTEKTLFTRFNQWIGTPAYMSPEQAGLASLDVDTRSDVYALGVLLYELLTGRTPFDTKRLLEAGFEAVLRTIREEEPPKPSTRLSTLGDLELGAIARQRGAEPAKLHRLIRGDLDWIVMKALEKDRTRRYETAAALAADVRHFLREEPVGAAAPTFTYQLSKFIRRNRTLLTAATVCVIAILAGAGFSFWQAYRATVAAAAAEQGRQQANLQAAIATAVRDFLERDLLAQATPWAGGEPKPEPDLNVRTLLDRASGKIAGKFTNQALVEASLRATMANAYHDLGEYQTELAHARRAAELFTRELGATNTRTLEARVETADAYRHLRQWPDALREFQEVRALNEQIHGPTHTNTLTSLRLLGVTLAEAGQTGDGQAMLEEAIRRNDAAGGAGEPRARELLKNLAATCANAGQRDRAEALYRRNLELTRAHVQPANRETLGSVYALAFTLHQERKLAEAETLYREASDLADRLLRPGENDGTILANLASVLTMQDRPDEAKSTYERALALRRAATAADSPESVDLLLGYAGLLSRQERFAEAEPHLREAIRIADRQPSPERTDPFLPRVLLATVLQSSGRTEEAARMVNELEARLSRRAESTAATHRDRALLSAVIRLQGRLAEGERLIHRNWETAAWAALDESALQGDRPHDTAAPGVILGRLAPLLATASATNRASAMAFWARGAYRGRQGHSAEAAEDLARCFEPSPDLLCLPLAALALDADASADDTRYRQKLWARYRRAPGRVTRGPIEYVPGVGWQPRTNAPGEPVTAAAVALALSLNPAGPPNENAAMLAAFAVEHGAQHPDLPGFQLALALTDYRRGQCAAAADGARRCLAASNPPPATLVMAHALLALAERQLGHADAAARALQSATQAITAQYTPPPGTELDLGPDWPEWIAARALVKEAARPAPSTKAPPRVAARVNGDVILEQEVRDRMQVEAAKLRELWLPKPTNDMPALLTPEFRRRLAELREQTLEELIDRMLIVQDYDRQGLRVRPEDLEEAVSQRIAQFYHGDRTSFRGALAAKGMTESAFRSIVEKDIACACLTRQQLEQVPAASRADAERFYQEHPAQFAEPEAFDVSLVTIAKASTNSTTTLAAQRREVEALRARLAAGADLAAAARDRETPPQPRSGGHLGWVQRDQFNPDLLPAVTALSPAGLSPVVETATHFFLIQLQGHRAAGVKPFAAVEPSIRDQLERERRAAARTQWLGELRRPARIERETPAPDDDGSP